MKELRYNISNWSQAIQCLSNNCKDLHISVMNVGGYDFKDGQVVSVVHPMYGTLFAATVCGHGELISDSDQQGNPLGWMTTEQVLAQLEKFGFLITYEPQKHLSGDQISYLMVLYNLGFQHINNITVIDDSIGEMKVTAFNGSSHPEFLKYPCCIPLAKYNSYLIDGTILDVSNMSKDEYFQWDWLTYVANIQDVLRENIPT